MNEDKTRGQILYLDRMKQPINFNNISIGKIVPCDIDLVCSLERKFCIEYHDKAWIFAEFKLRSKNFPTGQRLMHERLVDDLRKTGKPAISILAEHDIDDPTQEVDAAECIVREYYWNGKWHTCDDMKLKDVIFKFVGKVESGYLDDNNRQRSQQINIRSFNASRN